MIVLIVLVLLLLLAIFCLKGEGDCYGNINAKKDKIKKNELLDNNYLL